MKAPAILTLCTLLISAVVTTGCIRYVETRTDSAGISPIIPAQYLLVSPENVSSPELSLTQNLVANRLAAKGFSAAPNGVLYLQVGASIRPAALALTKPGGILAQADTKLGASKKCDWNEYRITLALTEIAGGREVYRSSAGEYHCKESFADTLPQLVGAAMADLGNPRGPIKTKRKLN